MLNIKAWYNHGIRHTTCQRLCVCVHHMKKCAYISCKGQSVKYIIIICSKHGNMIITKFCTQRSPKIHTKTSKYTFYQQCYAHHNTKHSIMNEHVIKTCKTSIIPSNSTKPLYQYHQKLQKPMFINNISISQHK